jgi:hypothetical protein
MSHLSSRDREHALKSLGIGPAAHLIRDAVLGERSPEDWFDPYADPEQPFRNFLSLLCSRLIASRRTARLLRATAWMLALLSFVDPPSWCQKNTDLALVQDATDVDDFGTCGVILNARGTAIDGTENVQLYPNSSSMWLTPTQSQLTEAFCLGIICFFLFLEFGADGLNLRRFFQAGRVGQVRIFRLFMIFVLVAALCVGNTAYSPFFRLMLLGTYLKSFQKELDSFFRMVSILRRWTRATNCSFSHLSVHWKIAASSSHNFVRVGLSDCLLRLVWGSHFLRLGTRSTGLFESD